MRSVRHGLVVSLVDLAVAGGHEPVPFGGYLPDRLAGGLSVVYPEFDVARAYQLSLLDL